MNIKENDLPGIGKNSKSKREIMKNDDHHS